MSGVLGVLLGSGGAAAGLLLDSLTSGLTGAYSTRRLLTAYAGSAIRVIRSSDAAELDIGFVSNDLDTASLATFIGANSAAVKTWYDQSGNARDLERQGVAQEPQITLTGTNYTINSNPVMFWNNQTAAAFLKNTATTADYIGAAAWTALALAKLNGAPGTFAAGVAPILSDTQTYWNPIITGTDGAAGFRVGLDQYDGAHNSTYNAVADATAFVIANKFGSGTLSTHLNGGTPATVASGAPQVTTNPTQVGRTSTTYFQGYVGELIIYNTALSSANLNTIGASMATRAGTTWTSIP